MALGDGAGLHSRSIRDLLRTAETIAIAIAAAIALGIWAASGWLASDWLTAKNLAVPVIAHAFALMGIVMALGVIEGLYDSCLMGLQRQVWQNVLTGITATVRGVGAVAILIWVSPSIEAFFIWQGATSTLSVAWLAAVVYRRLPNSPVAAQFSWPALMHVSRFATGIIVITFLTLLLTQLDKVLLSRLLTLEAFGYYALAGVIANALYMLVGPICTAFYPRFTELTERGDSIGLRATYHQAAQLTTVLMGSAAVVLIFFSSSVLLLWSGDCGPGTAPSLGCTEIRRARCGLCMGAPDCRPYSVRRRVNASSAAPRRQMALVFSGCRDAIGRSECCGVAMLLAGSGQR